MFYSNTNQKKAGIAIVDDTKYTLESKSPKTQKE